MRPESNPDSDRFDGSAIQRAISAITYPIQSFFADAFSGRDSISVDQSAGQKLLGVLTSPFRFLVGLGVFMVQAWATSRSGWSFLMGIPAIAILGLFGAGIWATNHWSATRIFGAAGLNYEMVAEDFPEHPEYRIGFAENMLAIKPESTPLKFELAQSKAGAGDVPGALDLMEMLAPDDHSEYADAHLWRAQYYQSEIAAAEDEETRKAMIEKHLGYAIEKSPGHLLAHLSLASIFDQKLKEVKEDDPKHREYLEQASEHYVKAIFAPMQDLRQMLVMPRLIQLTDDLHGEKAARTTLRKLIDRMKPVKKNNPDLFQVWLTLVRCAVQVEDYGMAQDFINEGFQNAQSPTVRQKIAALSSDVLLEEADNYKDMSNPEDFQRRLFALTRAININPKSVPAYQGLLKYITQSSGDSYNLPWLKETVVGAPYPGVIHVMLGLRAAMDGKTKVAKTHWRVSQQQFSLSQLILNNLIDGGAKSETQEFLNPVELLDQVIDSFPDQSVLHRTRGFYHYKNGNPAKAAADFERAVAKSPRMLDARKFLVKIYTSAGNSPKAAEHQKLLSDELDKMEPERRKTITKQLEAVDKIE